MKLVGFRMGILLLLFFMPLHGTDAAAQVDEVVAANFELATDDGNTNLIKYLVSSESLSFFNSRHIDVEMVVAF
ncbi:hypothetical protein ACWXWU_17400 [Shewanella sp. A14]